LPLPETLALSTPITVQVYAFEPGTARCWESTYVSPTRNTATEFRASR
jgi:hypothetical protein